MNNESSRGNKLKFEFLKNKNMKNFFEARKDNFSVKFWGQWKNYRKNSIQSRVIFGQLKLIQKYEFG